MKAILEYLISKNKIKNGHSDHKIKLYMNIDDFIEYIENDGNGFISIPIGDSWSDSSEYKRYSSTNYISLNIGNNDYHVNAIFNGYDELVKCIKAGNVKREAHDIDLDELIDYIDEVVKKK